MGWTITRHSGVIGFGVIIPNAFIYVYKRLVHYGNISDNRQYLINFYIVESRISRFSVGDENNGAHSSEK